MLFRVGATHAAWCDSNISAIVFASVPVAVPPTHNYVSLEPNVELRAFPFARSHVIRVLCYNLGVAPDGGCGIGTIGAFPTSWFVITMGSTCDVALTWRHGASARL